METIKVKDLIELAEAFGLPCIEETYVITIIGEEEFIVFNKVEEHKCQRMY